MRPHTTDGSFGSLGAGFNFTENRGAMTPLYKYRGGGSAVISRSIPPVVHPRAPPVGNYNVSRLMDDIVVDKDDIFGHCTTSSFKTSGRIKPLMRDAIHYATMREDEKFSNIGPGSYDYKDIWGSSNRMTVEFVPTGKSLSKPVGGIPFADRPWKQPPPLIMRKKLKQLSKLPPPTNKKAVGKIVTTDSLPDSDAKELQKDIETVRNLPNYE